MGENKRKMLIMSLLKRLYDDSLKNYLFAHKFKLFLILLIIVLSVVLISISPVAIALLLKNISADENIFAKDILLYISAFITLRFLGGITIDVRWVLINPFFYNITYDFSRTLVGKINAIFKNESGVNENALLISERIAVISKMQIGLMGVLYHLVSVIFPAILEMIIVFIIVFQFIGPMFIYYFLISVLMLFLATSFKREKEIEDGKLAYQSDNCVLSFCGEMITNTKLSREMEGRGYFDNVLNELIDDAISKYQKFFLTRFKRASCLTSSMTVSYIFIFLWAIYLINAGSIGGSQIFLLVIYLDRLLNPVGNMSSAINEILQGIVSINAGYKLLDSIIEEASKETYTIKEKQWDKVYFSDDVIFDDSTNILIIGKKRRIRFTGSSGSGKSTYLRKIYNYLIKNNFIDNNLVHYLNAHVELVSGTVFDNIALGNNKYTHDIIDAELSLWVSLMENRAISLYSDINTLSAGEKQWVAIVRSVLRAPKIIFFDEATNSLDIATEPLVWQYIYTKLTSSTLFIISHKNIFCLPVDYEENIRKIF